VEFVARHVEPLAGIYRLVTPPWDTLRWAHDKRLAYQVAGELRISTPKTWYPASEADLARMHISFPAIVKPAVSIRMQYAMGRKALEAHDRDALLHQYRAAGAVIGPDPLMIQEVIPGDGRTQYSVGAFCDQGSLVTAMTARRTRQFPFDYGVSSTFVEALEIPGLVEVSERLLHRLRLSGMVEVEFMHDPRDQRDKLLDINVRPWGWHSLAIACGLDLPYMQYRQALGRPVDRPQPRYGYRWRRLITDIPAGLQEIRHRRTSPAAYLRSLLRPAVPSVFDWGDPLPAIGDLAVSLRSRLRRKIRSRVRARLTPPLRT
jgi:D-aspartate ligase